MIVEKSRGAFVLLSLLFAGIAGAGQPLEPVDTSSPRATITSFLDLTEEAARRYSDYRDAPSRTTQDALWQLIHKTERLFDLSQVAPATRRQVADEAFYSLWDVLSRVELPDLAEIPGQSGVQLEGPPTAPKPRWRIPGTEITIARVEEGPRAGEFLFSPDTVNRATSFSEAARDLPYLRRMPIEDVYRIDQQITGWMIPIAWVEALPDWANVPLSGQVLWKWIALLLLLGLALTAAIALLRWARRVAWDGSFWLFLRHLAAPLAVFVLAWLVLFVARQQINVTGAATELPDLLFEISRGIAGAWAIWLTARWAAEIASPRTGVSGQDGNLIRLGVRTFGLLVLLVFGFRVANNLGIPIYGLVAGAGVGGLGIALAARSSLENFLGTLNLYADRPAQVGDFCRYGEDPDSNGMRLGTIEEIGLRSTRVRGLDRTITTIPNAEFSNMHIVNLARRDRILFTTKLALRYETTPDQLRLVLVRIREMLVAHPRVTMAPARVRAIGFGEYSLNLEIFAYVDTSEWDDFVAVREDLILRIMDIVKDAGTAFAVPSRTLYHGRDSRPGLEGREAAEEQVRQWIADGSLPFPDFSPEYRKEIRDTLDYPPEGSTERSES